MTRTCAPDRYQFNTVRGYVVEDDGWRWTPATLERVEDFVARTVDSLPPGMSSGWDD